MRSERFTEKERERNTLNNRLEAHHITHNTEQRAVTGASGTRARENRGEAGCAGRSRLEGRISAHRERS